MQKLKRMHYYITIFFIKIGMILGVSILFVDVIAIYKGTPVENFIYFRTGLIFAKLIVEIPLIYYLIKHVKCVFLFMWLASRAVSAIIPLVGPLIDLIVVRRFELRFKSLGF